MSARYRIVSGVVVLTGTSPRVLANIIAAANAPIRLIEWGISFDGVTATAVPALVELANSTQAGAGTVGSSPTPVQIGGRDRTVQAAAGVAYTTGADPSVLTNIQELYVPQFMGIFVQQFPLGREPETLVAASTEGILIRVTPTATVNARAWMIFEEG